MDRGREHPAGDRPASAPANGLSLSRVGVTGIEKVIRVSPVNGGSPKLFAARLQCFLDLGGHLREPDEARFDDVINEVTREVVLGEAGFRAEQLARRIAERVRERQGARRAEVTI